jgi:hypothetical protein
MKREDPTMYETEKRSGVLPLTFCKMAFTLKIDPSEIAMEGQPGGNGE